LQTMINESQANVNGDVRVKLYKGSVSAVGRRSEDSLFDENIATFEDDAGAYDHHHTPGAITQHWPEHDQHNGIVGDTPVIIDAAADNRYHCFSGASGTEYCVLGAPYTCTPDWSGGSCEIGDPTTYHEIPSGWAIAESTEELFNAIVALPVGALGGILSLNIDTKEAILTQTWAASDFPGDAGNVYFPNVLLGPEGIPPTYAPKTGPPYNWCSCWNGEPEMSILVQRVARRSKSAELRHGDHFDFPHTHIPEGVGKIPSP
jgi:hypothetical protein